MILESSSLNKNKDDFETKIENKQTDYLICSHCGRSSVNGIKCIGKCLADSDY